MIDFWVKWGLVIGVFVLFFGVIVYDHFQVRKEGKGLDESWASLKEKVDVLVEERNALREKVSNQRASEIRIMADRLWAPGMSAEEAIACAVVNHAQLSRVEIPEEPDVEGREEDAALDVFGSLTQTDEEEDAPEEAPADCDLLGPAEVDEAAPDPNESPASDKGPEDV